MMKKHKIDILKTLPEDAKKKSIYLLPYQQNKKPVGIYLTEDLLNDGYSYIGVAFENKQEFKNNMYSYILEYVKAGGIFDTVNLQDKLPDSLITAMLRTIPNKTFLVIKIIKNGILYLGLSTIGSRLNIHKILRFDLKKIKSIYLYSLILEVILNEYTLRGKYKGDIDLIINFRLTDKERETLLNNFGKVMTIDLNEKDGSDEFGKCYKVFYQMNLYLDKRKEAVDI